VDNARSGASVSSAIRFNVEATWPADVRPVDGRVLNYLQKEI
jgi:hypothetical protein